MTEEAKERAVLVYAGQRLTSKETLSQAFAYEDRVLLFKSLVKYPHVGARYVAEATITDEGGFTVHGDLKRDGEHDDAHQVEGWKLEDAAARANHATIQADKKMAKEDDILRELCLPLRKVLAGHGSVSRYALILAISSELHRPLTQAEKAS